MNKSRCFSLLALSILLSGCGGQTSSITSSSETSFSSSSSSSSIENSSSSESSSSSETLESLVEQKLGDRAKLRDHLLSLNEDLSSYTKTFHEKSKYDEITKETNVTLKTNEILSIETNEDYVITNYAACKDDTFYTLSLNEADPSLNTAKRQKFEENEVASVDSIVNKYDLNEFVENTNYGWRELFNDKLNEETSYSTSISNDTVSVRAKLVRSYTEFLFSATFDSSLNLISGSLTKYAYPIKSWNTETNTPEGDVEPNRTSTNTLSNIVHGRETAEEYSYDLSAYFITSLTGEINVYSTHYQENPYKEYTSNANEFYAGAYIDAGTVFGGKLSYEPSTALDYDTIKITSSSNLNAVYPSANNPGDWRVGNTIGETSILTIGNDYNPEMASVTVTIVAIPGSTSDDSDDIVNNPPVYDSSYTIIDTLGNEYTNETISIDTGINRTCGIPTSNKGPFSSLDTLSFSYSTDGVAEVSLSSMHDQYVGTMSYYVFIDVNAIKTGNTIVTINLGETLFCTITIIVA